MPLVSAGVWLGEQMPVPTRPAFPVSVPASGGAVEALGPPVSWATTLVDRWFQPASETRRTAIGPGVADLLGGMVKPILPPVDVFAAQYLQYLQTQPEPRRPAPGVAALCGGQLNQVVTTPPVDLLNLRFLQTPCDVLPRPRPVIYPQNPSEGVPSVAFAFTIDLWYQPASQPLPRLSSRIDGTGYAQPLEPVQLDQKLAWLTRFPDPLPPRTPRSTVPLESSAAPVLTDAMRVNLSWYVAPAGPLPLPPRTAALAAGFVLGRLPSTVIVTGPFFATAISIYAAGAVAFDEEPTL